MPEETAIKRDVQRFLCVSRTGQRYPQSSPGVPNQR
jgi:hypothetical protein